MTRPVTRLPGAATLHDLIRNELTPFAARAGDPPPERTVNPGYSTGYKSGADHALRMALEQHTRDAPDWATPLRKLAADLGEEIRRTRAAQTAIPATNRAGRCDALEEARSRTSAALDRANAAASAAAAADTAAHPVIGSAAVPPGDDLSDWSGYPKTFPEDAAVEDISHLALFLGGDGTSFTGDLLRLIAKADPGNLNKLVQVYPRHVRAWVMWRACSPVPARTLVALLEASHAMEARNR